ncbi:hypothetical protein IFM89_009370 [Coptis chinensis]|uniref:KIB1-4 beta-propeller domain-containing protein n=1 Tax=Coptis chinensis TaxID=261450 RepID=A0A835HGZ2_9MAGN|nr:hypothetical protein IFM89_009370 [Coptis chinensis]
MAAPMSQLPPELLLSIASKLKIYKDYIRFRSTCVNFHSNLPSRPRHLPCQFPWLLLPLGQNRGRIRTSFSLSDNKFYRLELPETRQRRCCGSSNGWLVLLDQTPSIYLLNILTKEQFQLPVISTFPNVLDYDVYKLGKEYIIERRPGGGRYTRNLKDMRNLFIRKIVLSTSPLNEKCIAVAILNESDELAFCKEESDSWSMIDDARLYSEDVVYHNGMFYAVSKKGGVAVFDLGGNKPVVSFIFPPVKCDGDILYLVVSDTGGIFLVTRYLNFVSDVEPDLIYSTVGFDVFELVASDMNWVPVKSLGDRMFFLGGNSSLCLLASDFPGCNGNRIYFTDEYTEANDGGARADHDVGVFMLEDGSLKMFPCWSSHSRSIRPPHIWVTPSPW